MPAKKALNKVKTNSSPNEDNDVSYASSQANSAEDASPEPRVGENTGTTHNTDVIEILDKIRNDFSMKIDVVLKAIQDVKRDVQDFSACIDEAEVGISNVEDTVNSEKNKSDALENDAVAFLEKWLPEALGPETLYIERAHRLPKFLNFQDKVRVMRAARAKGKVTCGGRILFFPDLSAELHRRRRCFDRVKEQLRSMNISYGIIYPAKLRVSSDGQICEFETPAEAEKFVQGLKTS
ncbi:zinc finger and BTB domain-containing protein 44 [Sarotherodon galilaeus]